MRAAAAPEATGRILVVEDDPAAARFAVYVLGERGGFEIIHLTDPVVAIERVQCERWDLVLADLDLPHMSGLDLLASVRRIAPRLPVLLTTATAMDPAAIRALCDHADAFLCKPIRARRLIDVATALIANGPGQGLPPGDTAELPGSRHDDMGWSR
jgi:DNA-binding response OmpR family regulator